MKISIIIPVYNVDSYMENCLKSIEAQNYKGKIECLIVDDCGSDSSIDIAKQFIDAYQGPIAFKIIHHEKNSGLSVARNTGIFHATGDYLYFLDSDDTITSDCISSMVEAMGSHKGVDMVVAGARMSNGGNWFSMSNRMHFPDYTEDREWIKLHQLLQLLPMTSWNHLIKASLIKKHKLEFYPGLLNEDELWNYKLAKVVTSVAICKKDTYNYLVRPGSIQTDSTKLEQRWKSAQIIIREWILDMDNFLKDEQLFVIFNRIYSFYLSPLVPNTLKDIQNMFSCLMLHCNFRKRFAIKLLFFLPRKLFTTNGIAQRLIVDIFGQNRCRNYADHGIRRYLKFKLLEFIPHN